MGDFNVTELAEDNGRLRAINWYIYEQVGWGMGFTFPDFASAFGIGYLPLLVRIDYIFHNDFFIPLEARVGADSGGSDHFPLYSVLELQSPGRE